MTTDRDTATGEFFEYGKNRVCVCCGMVIQLGSPIYCGPCATAGCYWGLGGIRHQSRTAPAELLGLLR